MLKTFWATVRQGKIELLESAELPEGAKVLVTVYLMMKLISGAKLAKSHLIQYGIALRMMCMPSYSINSIIWFITPKFEKPYTLTSLYFLTQSLSRICKSFSSSFGNYRYL